MSVVGKVFVEKFMEQLVAKNASEKEFHQAVQEVVESLVPVPERNPRYLEHKILERITEPERVILFRVPWMDDRGEIVAVDVSPERLARVQENCRRMGLTIVRTLAAEAVASLPERSFDLVLVDAPCSNTGVLARRVEARWRFSLRNLRALAQTQRRLLLLGARYVRPGGLCAYSTCSLEPEENRSVVREVLSREGRLTLVDEQEIPPAGADAPCRWSDGGYLAVLRA